MNDESLRRSLVDEYELAVEELIDTGSFGDVYLCVDSNMHDQVAVKVLAQDLAHDESYCNEFLREARWLRELQSRTDCRHIVQVLGFGTADNRPFFSMPYADKGSLERLGPDIQNAHLADRAALALEVVRCLESAMTAIHAEDKVHRDIKPANLLIKSGRDRQNGPKGLVLASDRLFLGDLGLAKATGQTEDHGLSGAVGTVYYMAPEMMEEGEPGKPRSEPTADIYSATATVIFALTGRTIHPTWQASLDSLGFTRDLVSRLERGLAHDPEDRYQYPDEWGTSLTKALESRANNPDTLRDRRRPAVRTGTYKRSSGPIARTIEVLIRLAGALWTLLTRVFIIGVIGLLGFLLYSSGAVQFDVDAITAGTTTTNETRATSTSTAPPVATTSTPTTSGDAPTTTAYDQEVVQLGVDRLLADTGVAGAVERVAERTIVYLTGTVIEHEGLVDLLIAAVESLPNVDAAVDGGVVVKADADPLIGGNLIDLMATATGVRVQPVTFDGGSSIPEGGDADEALTAMANFLKARPEITMVEIGGHTDNRGRGNATMSRSRANAARQFLIDAGVERNRVVARGYSSDCPLASNDTEAGRARNRRVEAIIVGVDGSTDRRPQLVCA
jgi:serine/threonine protein kinase